MKKKLFAALFALLFCCSSLVGNAFADAADEGYWSDVRQVNEYLVKITASDGGANLRSGPGTDYPILLDHMMPNDTILTIYSECKAANGKKWGYTQYSSQYWGWVSLTQVSAYAPPKPTAAAVERNVSYHVEVNAPDGGVNLRSGPGADYNILLKNMIPNGEVLQIDKEKPATNKKLWGHTTYQSLEGWIFLGQTTTVNPSAPTSVAETTVAATTAAETTVAVTTAAETSANVTTAAETIAAPPPVLDAQTAAPSLNNKTVIMTAVLFSIVLALALTATILLIIMSKKQKAQSTLCPFCNTTLRSDALFCPGCGKKIR